MPFRLVCLFVFTVGSQSKESNVEQSCEYVHCVGGILVQFIVYLKMNAAGDHCSFLTTVLSVRSLSRERSVR